MTNSLRLTLAASVFALAAAALPALAADGDTVAKVGNETITEKDLDLAVEDLGDQFGQMPDEQRRLAVLSALIDIKSLAKEAADAGLDKTAEVKSQLAFLRERALHNAYFKQKGIDTITDDELKQRYDKEIAAMPKSDEVHARHILVKTKEEAEDIIKQLDAGADFEKLASEKSTGPSGPQGGDLGFFGPGQMVPAFDKAAFALEPGKYTEQPVQTQFGWHVIKVEEKRPQQPPAFDQVKDQVRQVVMREKYMQLVQKARSDLKVEFVDPKIKTQIEEIQKSAAGAAEAPAAQ
ncbi:peptidylprolyl isomerase [Mangrovibrevibacter kandeliae]|uniref:peptidylprolyl isomerase n=1 Tax=Mangrovibrevibacter kandeliae TaxID=2968473 RepID=UPI0021195E32|nr:MULTISPECIES: peptidylprolyl isomerase [unclassified Aurantimonas]MCQ8783886.1 peptidylprolyl isomerase [Aurantimonas sp. CSK15Z-1]MCW4116605.1 peptidylprolyl isomerase [Aurantimonas sp. MSK8Z-1]